jgi:hypothetical protein
MPKTDKDGPLGVSSKSALKAYRTQLVGLASVMTRLEITHTFSLTKKKLPQAPQKIPEVVDP